MTRQLGARVPGSVGVQNRHCVLREIAPRAPLIEANTALNRIPVPGSAPEYTIGVGFVGVTTLTLNGLGVTNLSSNAQGIELGSSGTLIFSGGARLATTLTTRTLAERSSLITAPQAAPTFKMKALAQSLSTIAMRAVARSTTTKVPSISRTEATLTASNSSAAPPAPAPSFSVAAAPLAARKSKSRRSLAPPPAPGLGH